MSGRRIERGTVRLGTVGLLPLEVPRELFADLAAGVHQVHAVEAVLGLLVQAEFGGQDRQEEPVVGAALGHDLAGDVAEENVGLDGAPRDGAGLAGGVGDESGGRGADDALVGTGAGAHLAGGDGVALQALVEAADELLAQELEARALANPALGADALRRADAVGADGRGLEVPRGDLGGDLRVRALALGLLLLALGLLLGGLVGGLLALDGGVLGQGGLLAGLQAPRRAQVGLLDLAPARKAVFAAS